jgi:hypothetical protein
VHGVSGEDHCSKSGPDSLAGGNSNEKNTFPFKEKSSCMELTFGNTASHPSPLQADTVAGSFQMGKILNR